MDAASLDAMMPWRPGIAPDEAATTNDGEEPATKSGAPKKKRQRLVHPNHDSFGACDTCRARRVKCIRDDPESPVCEACRTRDIVCTQFRNGGLRYKPRARKKARTDEPEAADQSMALVRTRSSTDHSPPDSSSGSHRSLSDDSPDGRLTLSQETNALLASLMDSYLDSASFAGPLVNWANLRMRFERAGRRPHQLDPMTETLVLACIAFGAFASDHPLILGNDAPRLVQLDAEPPKDLSVWSRRRMPFCEKLVEQVVKLVDTRGFFRIAAPETAALLHMTAELVGYMGDYEASDPYDGGALTHLRRMKDDAHHGNDLSLGLEWGLAISDCFAGAVTGSSLMMSDEALTVLLCLDGEHKCEAPTLDSVSVAIFSDDLKVFGHPLGNFWLALIRLARGVARRIAQPVRKGQVITIETWQEYIAEAEELFRLTTSARDLAKKLAPMSPIHVSTLQRHVFGADALSHFVACHLAVGTVLMCLAGHYQAWRERHRIVHEIATGGKAGAFEEEETILRNMDAAVGADLVAALCASAMAIKEPNSGSVSSLTSHLSILSCVQRNLDVCAAVSVHLPCADERGPPSYTRELKIECATTFIGALRHQSWTWAEKATLADSCEAKLNAFKATDPSRPPDSPEATASKGPSPPLSRKSPIWETLRQSAGRWVTPQTQTAAASGSSSASPIPSVSGMIVSGAVAPTASVMDSFLTSASASASVAGSTPSTGASEGDALTPDLLDFLGMVSGVPMSQPPVVSAPLEPLPFDLSTPTLMPDDWAKLFNTPGFHN